jgi:lipopolysaccharide biosynthesis glycosyltransferase
MTAMNILFCIDDAYLAQVAVSISSVLGSNPHVDLNVTVAGAGLDTEKASHLLAPLIRKHGRCRLTLHALDDKIFAGLPSAGRFSMNTYARILLNHFTAPEMDRVLYLDADTIIQADLEALWAMDLNGMTIGAARDHFRLDNQAIGFADDEPYFNAGVLLFDMKAWRARGYEQRVLRFLVEQGHDLPWLDQDALNVILRDDARFIDIGWNFQPRCADVPASFLGLSEGYYDSLRRKPHIVHFTTSLKPWTVGSRVHYSDLFFQAAGQAGLGNRFPKPRPNDLRQSLETLKTVLRWHFPRTFRLARALVKPQSAAPMYRAGAQA